MEKLKVEIWSDIMCPFCYIGKRHFEEAMKRFEHADKIEVEWHSFLLDPEIAKPSGGSNVYEYLAERKGITLEQSKTMHNNVVEMAKRAGLDYRFDITMVANTFDAHRLIQFAKTKGLADKAEEHLFRAYFTQGKDLSAPSALIAIAIEIGLNGDEAKAVINSYAFSDEVNSDIDEAARLGIRGVPFFVLNRKYGISGAQPPQTFIDALRESFDEANKNSS
jgi:predicted DsbA family dithiol-disulfide isomerase